MSSKKRFQVLICGFLALICGLSTSLADNAPMAFGIDSTRSQVTIAGSVAGVAFSAQAPGSLTAAYQGTINASYTNSTMQFTGGSEIAAITNGVWQPAIGGAAGSALADYGITNSINFSFGPPNYVPGNAAIRNVLFDLTSPSLGVTNGIFDASSLVFSFATNIATLDYDYPNSSGQYAGTEGLNGYATNNVGSTATLSTNFGVLILTIQINAQYVFSQITPNDSAINLTGQLVATNAISSLVPVIQSIQFSSPNVTITVSNATLESSLVVSTDLINWSPASATLSTNAQGLVIFTVPMNEARAFYRVEQ